MKSERTFGQLLRGLQVYGYKVIDGKARMLSFSERRTDGVVKGTVVDLEKLHNCVHEVVNDLERVAQRGIED